MRRVLTMQVLLVGLVFGLVAGGVSAASASAPPKSSTTFEKQIHAGVNKARTQSKRVALKHQACLDRYAQAHANAMAKQAKPRLYHQNLRPILSKCKMRSVGENVAWGQRTGAEAVAGWLNSPGHRKNIMNKGFRLSGIGVAKDRNGRVYSVQVFGQRR